MDIFSIETRKTDLKEYSKRSALESDYEHVIKNDTVVYYQGKPILFYAKLDWDFEPLRKVLKSTEYPVTTRTGGLKTQSRVFGYQPRIAVRRDYCTKTSLASNNPDANNTICKYGRRIAPIYSLYFPEVFLKHQAWSKEKIKEEWKIDDSPFTSGIINKNNPLKYHYDAGNIQDVCSCMLALKHNVGGGLLSMPEFGIALEIADKSLTIFDGQAILHGVTPIRKLSHDAYRYTVVYYTLQQMWKCHPYSEEMERIKKVRTFRERKRAGLLSESELHVSQHGVESGEVE